MERISHRKPSDRLTFGYRRYSVLGALFSSIVLITGSVFILLEAIPRLIHPEPVIAEGMLPMAVLGITVNIIAVLRLRGDGDRLNQRVIMLHLLEDVLGWVGVLVVSIVLLFVDLPVLDPILSIVITVYVLSRIFPRLTEALRVFLQYSPGGIELRSIRDKIREDHEISDIHDTHLWSVDGHDHVFSAHLVLTRNMTLVETEEVKERVKSRLAELGIDHATLEMEPAESLCKGCKE
jgi:cobalt-zinc-cadmium efflux system protein